MKMRRGEFLISMLGGAAATAPFAAGCKAPRSTPAASARSSRAEQLVDRIINNTNAAYFVGAAYIGDRLGLIKAMAGAGPLTAKQLSEKTGLNERYLLEWLRSMASSHYLDYHPESNLFELPADGFPQWLGSANDLDEAREKMKALPPPELGGQYLIRDFYSGTNPAVTAALSPRLLEHRDFIYREYLELPVVF